jgi:hypothetical protein
MQKHASTSSRGGEAALQGSLFHCCPPQMRPLVASISHCVTPPDAPNLLPPAVAASDQNDLEGKVVSHALLRKSKRASEDKGAMTSVLREGKGGIEFDTWLLAYVD